MKRFLIILCCLLVIAMIFSFGFTAYASSSVEGFSESLQAGLKGLREYFKFVIDLFKVIL